MRRSLAMAGGVSALLMALTTPTWGQVPAGGSRAQSSGDAIEGPQEIVLCSKNADCGTGEICVNKLCVESCADSDGTAVNSFLVQIFKDNFPTMDLYTLLFEGFDGYASTLYSKYAVALSNAGYTPSQFKDQSKVALLALYTQLTMPGQGVAYEYLAGGGYEKVSGLDTCKNETLLTEAFCTSTVGASGKLLQTQGWQCPGKISNNVKAKTTCRLGTHPVSGVTAGFCAVADEYPVKNPPPPGKPPTQPPKPCAFPCFFDATVCDECPATLECEQPGEVCPSGEDLCPDLPGMQTEADGYGPGKKECTSIDEKACQDPDPAANYPEATVICLSGKTQCHIDSCADIDTVKHLLCGTGTNSTTFYTNCPPTTTCKKGLCNGQPPPEKLKCEDTDKDVNDPSDVKQAVFGHGQSGNFSKQDGCAGENIAQEWSCDLLSPAGYKSETKACPAQQACCSDHCGEPPALNCTDTDPTNDVHTMGVITGVPNFSDDVCLSGETSVVIQSNCDPFNSCAGVVKLKSFCPVGEICQDGVCVPEPEDTPTCTLLSDTDPGDLSEIAGTVGGMINTGGVTIPFTGMDQCVSETSVKNVQFTGIPPCTGFGRVMSCPDGMVCEQPAGQPGKCVPGKPPITITCNDTDLPDDPLKGGVVTIGELAPHPDHCNPVLPNWLVQMGCVDGLLQTTQQTDCSSYFEGFEGSCVNDAVNGAVCAQGAPKPPPDRGETPPPDEPPPDEPPPDETPPPPVCTPVSDSDPTDDPTLGGLLKVKQNSAGADLAFGVVDMCDGTATVLEAQFTENFPCYTFVPVSCPQGTECVQSAGKSAACAKSLPKPPPPLSCNESDYVVKDIVAGGNSTCAIVDTPEAKGTVWCWGQNTNGEVFPVTSGLKQLLSPAPYPEINGAVSIEKGSGYSVCTLLSSGKVLKCWGGPVPWFDIPSNSAWVGGDKVAGGGGNGDVNCVRGLNKTLWCIGAFYSPTLTFNWKMLKPQLSNLNGKIEDMDVYDSKAICIATGSSVNCHSYEQVITGIDPKDPYGELVGQLPGLKHLSKLPADRVSIQDEQRACARAYHDLGNSGEIWCWGGTQDTPLGYIKKYYATFVTDGIQVEATPKSVCAIGLSGDVKCWGYNSYFHFPTQPDNCTAPSESETPFFCGVTGAIDLALGSDHTCVLFNDSSVKCWGKNDHGQLGIGNALPMDPYGAATPVPVQFCPYVIAPIDLYGVPIP